MEDRFSCSTACFSINLRRKRLPKRLNQPQVSPLPSSPSQPVPTAAPTQQCYHPLPWKGVGRGKQTRMRGTSQPGEQGNTCHCSHWLEVPCPSLPTLTALALRTVLTKETPTGSSHRSPTARVSGNWGEMGRKRVCPKTKWDRRFPLFGNLSVCSRDLQNKDLHMVILARTGRLRLSFSTP